MKDNDLIYIGIIGVLVYFLFKKENTVQVDKATDPNANPVGNASNGGLNLPSNMDLPNLTATPADGLPTEVALNSSNVCPIVKDENFPTQVYGEVTLPPAYTSTSVVSPNPVDVVPTDSTTTYPTASTPTVSDTRTVYTDVVTNIGELPSPIPANTGTSIIQEPMTPIKNIEAEIVTETPTPISQPKSDGEANDIIAKCGNSFSIPNNDREGSYTNFWYDGRDFYTQTTSPLMRTIAVKINGNIYLEACKKFQLLQFKYQNN
jgi:hypothetical protein